MDAILRLIYSYGDCWRIVSSDFPDTLDEEVDSLAHGLRRLAERATNGGDIIVATTKGI